MRLDQMVPSDTAIRRVTLPRLPPNAARVKQRVNKELATAMGAERRIVSALHHGALGRALSDARDRVHHEGTPLVQSVAVQPASDQVNETSEA